MMAARLVGLCPSYVWLHLLFCIQEYLVLQLARAGLGGRSDEIEEKDFIDGIRRMDSWGCPQILHCIISILLLSLVIKNLKTLR